MTVRMAKPGRSSRAPLACCFVASLLNVAPLARAQDAEEGKDKALAMGVSVDGVSRYTWRGLVLNDDPALQPSVSLTYGGFTVGVWGSLDLTDSSEDLGHGYRHGAFSEVDLSLDYEHSFGLVSLSTGLVLYDFPGTGLPNTTELHVGVDADLAVDLSFAAWYDIAEANGFYLEAGAAREIGVGKSASLELGATLGWADADWRGFNCGVENSGWMQAELGVILSAPVGERVTLRPFTLWSTLLDDEVRAGVDRSDAFVAGFGFDYTW